jgi:hypothetical protein
VLLKEEKNVFEDKSWQQLFSVGVFFFSPWWGRNGVAGERRKIRLFFFFGNTKV